MNEIIIFDFEVFNHDCLLGVLHLTNSGLVHHKFWKIEDIRKFYYLHEDDFWIGHNSASYDNAILNACVNGKTEEEIKDLSNRIVQNGERYYKGKVPAKWYDLMQSFMYSLKAVEAFEGKSIKESEVDFNLPRKLTDEEKLLTEQYNLADLEQTLSDFKWLQNEFILRLDMIKEFNLPMSGLNTTATQIAAKVLKAKRIPGIETQKRHAVMWPKLKIKDQNIVDFYMSERWKNKERYKFTLGNCPFVISSGGIHAALSKYHCKKGLYMDVSGYYNLLMILLDLYPRTLSEESKNIYQYLYHEQLRLKKIDPNKRGIFKTVLLCVWGAMKQEHCDFYDPENGDLLLLSGQMFLVDLCEKLDGKVQIVQVNTDGVIVVPNEGVTNDDIKEIVDEWQNRTGFVLKFDEIYDIHQRDVNNYMYRDATGYLNTVGESVTHYEKWSNPFWKKSFSAKEPIIISYMIVQYFMEHKLPEETMKQYKDNLRMFQYIPKKISYDYLEYEETDIETGDTSVSRIQNVNRAFALKSDKVRGMVYKCKWSGKHDRVSNLPDSVFVYNDEILSEDAVKNLVDKIDYDYYVNRGYERIAEYINMEDKQWKNTL